MDTWIDPGTETVRAIHLDPLVGWLTSEWLGAGPVRLLDLGCGDMLISRLLPAGNEIDGYDPSEPARNAARVAGARAGASGCVFDHPTEIPVGVYDGVIISSVLQYLPDEQALTEMLRDAARWLRPMGSLGVVATDVPLPGGRRWSDAGDLSVELSRRLGPFAAMRELVRAARRSPGDLRSFAVAEVENCAALAGMGAVRLDRNLSPFRSRASYLFRSRIDDGRSNA